MQDSPYPPDSPVSRSYPLGRAFDSDTSPTIYIHDDGSPKGFPAPASTAHRSHSPTGRDAAAALRPASVMPALLWIFGLLVAMALIVYVIPQFAEQMVYSYHRGKLKAEHEAAGEALANAPLNELSRNFQLISQRVAPSVVHITTARASRNRMGNPLEPREVGQGSGVIVASDGYILTNNHVIQGTSQIQVNLSDGRVFTAEVIGIDPETDLALIKIQTDELTPAEWGDSDSLEVGSLVWAVGSPFGLQRSITFGILSAKNRAGLAGSPYQDFLQTDAAVNPGNSGGPLVDVTGKVIGINAAIVGPSYQGISFAIPSNVAHEVYEKLRTDRKVVRGWLGVALDSLTKERARQLGLDSTDGALVTAVVDHPDVEAPAKEAGVEAGDVIVRWNGKDITNPSTLSREVGQTEIGSRVEVEIIREGKPLKLDVKVGVRPRT